MNTAESETKSVTITRNERRWHWRTWNVLLQIQRATDGEDPRQRSGEMTVRGLCSAETSEIRAMHTRKWIEATDAAECVDDHDDEVRYLPVWSVTPAGREAILAARAAGITVQ